MILFLLIHISFNPLFAQYQIEITNNNIISEKVFEFEIFVKSTGTEVVISSYQCALNFNFNATNGEKLSFTYISGSSELINYPLNSVGIQTEQNISKLCFASYIGTDTIGTYSKRIGKFRIENTNSFNYDSLNIDWNFDGKKKTIFVDNKFADITYSNNFINNSDPVPPIINNYDITPPTLVNAKIYLPTILKLYFSEPILVETVIPSNFKITNNINVIGASLSEDKMQVTLNTTSHVLYQSYTITIQNVNDINGNVISATNNCISYTFSDKVIRNAEEGILAFGATLKEKTGSIGKKVAYCTSKSSTITFSVYFPKTSKWYAWGRFYFEGSGSAPNSFAIKVDNGHKYIFGNDNYFNVWHWGANGTDRRGSIRKLLLGTISKGKHTITIYGNEIVSAVMIDQILLSPSSNFVPSDASIQLSKDEDSEYNENQDDQAINIDLPKDVELFQNYPNPFNPTTKIKYALLNDTYVRLIVFDILGKEIAALVNEEKQAGYYEVEFNPNQFSEISSGIYIFSLITKEFVISKKMTFLK
jgi:hypothetical protein